MRNSNEETGWRNLAGFLCVNTNLQNYLPSKGGTLTGNLNIQKNDTAQVMIESLNHGTSGVMSANQYGFGLYDITHGKWLVRSDDGNVTLNGNANTATALTTSAGSSSRPVYFSGGKPVEVSNIADKNIIYNLTGGTVRFLKMSDQKSMHVVYMQTGSSGWSKNIIGIYPNDDGTYGYSVFDGRATQDGNGNNIVNTYLPKSGGTMTGDLKMESGASLFLGSGYFNDNGAQWYSFMPSSSEGSYGVFYGVRDSRWGFAPYANGMTGLGSSNYKWNAIYCTTSTISTSDRNLKKDIATLTEQHLKFFTLLQPVSYKFIDGTSGRTHIGFISQDVEEAMAECGLTDLDFAGFCKDQKEVMVKKTREDTVLNEETGEEEIVEVEYEESVPVEGEYIYSLRYEEFIALNTMASQYTIKKLEDVETSLESLEERLAALEAKLG